MWIFFFIYFFTCVFVHVFLCLCVCVKCCTFSLLFHHDVGVMSFFVSVMFIFGFFCWHSLLLTIFLSLLHTILHFQLLSVSVFCHYFLSLSCTKMLLFCEAMHDGLCSTSYQQHATIDVSPPLPPPASHLYPVALFHPLHLYSPLFHNLGHYPVSIHVLIYICSVKEKPELPCINIATERRNTFVSARMLHWDGVIPLTLTPAVLIFKAVAMVLFSEWGIPSLP